MTHHPSDDLARQRLSQLARDCGLDVFGGRVRRASSRFCLGVEHGDYNGTDLFGVGTDRFLWVAYKANDRGRVRLCSANFAADGVVEFRPGTVPPPPPPPAIAASWARFPFGVDHVLRRAGLPTDRGFDAVVFGDIPGGGMSRSAALTLNLILSTLDVNGGVIPGDAAAVGRRVVDLARQVENDYVGSPCGVLDQTMIYFARAGAGTHYRPADRSIEYVPLGSAAPDFRLVALDTGTVRPGLEHSTYRLRRAECERCVALLADRFGIASLAELTDPARFAAARAWLQRDHPDLADRLTYVHEAWRRFPQMLDAWRRGDVATLGALFRADGHGLRDQYRISGPELEAMCELARTVPGVHGERMLGGGDKGAAGAIVAATALDDLRATVAREWPRRYPALAERCAVHDLAVVDGIAVLDAPLGAAP